QLGQRRTAERHTMVAGPHHSTPVRRPFACLPHPKSERAADGTFGGGPRRHLGDGGGGSEGPRWSSVQPRETSMPGPQPKMPRPILLLLVYGVFLALVGITAT